MRLSIHVRKLRCHLSTYMYYNVSNYHYHIDKQVKKLLRSESQGMNADETQL